MDQNTVISQAQPVSGVVFDIKRFSIQDGPGIRTTVFFKGCPLRCSWCHNPESFRAVPEAVFYPDRCISASHSCLVRCLHGAIDRDRIGDIHIDRSRCRGCGECERACPAEAVRTIGRLWNAPELLKEIAKDRVFFDQSSGGVTASGGEPMLQAQFLADFLRLCRANGLHTSIDTCGFAAWSAFTPVLANTDLFLYDLKLIDAELHRRYTGQDNRLILENLQLLDQAGASVIVRVPLIPAITTTDENIAAILNFLLSRTRLRRISLLNYHRGGLPKTVRLGIGESDPGWEPLPEETLQRLRNRFSENGFDVTLGE